jgi:ankyrin repeat protein
MSKENTLFKTLEIKSDLLRGFLHDKFKKLCFYIKDNNFNKFQQVITKNAGLLEKIDSDDNTLLNLAVQCNNFKIAELLISQGAKVNTQNVN